MTLFKADSRALSPCCAQIAQENTPQGFKSPVQYNTCHISVDLRASQQTSCTILFLFETLLSHLNKLVFMWCDFVCSRHHCCSNCKRKTTLRPLQCKTWRLISQIMILVRLNLGERNLLSNNKMLWKIKFAHWLRNYRLNFLHNSNNSN